MGTRGFINAAGTRRLSKEQISEKVKIMGGDLVSVRLDPRYNKTVVPGTILKYNVSTRKYVPLGENDTVGYETGQISPGTIKLSVSFGEQGTGYSNRITVNTLASEYRAQLAFNHPLNVTARAGAAVFIEDGEFRALPYEQVTKGAYIVGYLEKPVSLGDEIWYLNTAGGGDYQRSDAVTTLAPTTPATETTTTTDDL